MNYKVLLIESDEGFSVSCPALKGCHSQGATREEALENIQDAIREWLEAEMEMNVDGGIFEMNVGGRNKGGKPPHSNPPNSPQNHP